MNLFQKETDCDRDDGVGVGGLYRFSFGRVKGDYHGYKKESSKRKHYEWNGKIESSVEFNSTLVEIWALAYTPGGSSCTALS